MDFLDPRKKRAHNIRLIVGYLLVAVALAMGALILVLLSYGYDLDRKTGEVIQNGLVFISSQPPAADIDVNGNHQGRTNTKMVLPAGQYTIDLKRSGYRTWSRKFSLQGGSVERLDYPLLFPNKLTSQDVDLYSTTPSLATASPDRHWLLIQQPGQLLKFDLVDLSSDSAPVTVISLPATLLTASSDPNQTWQFVEWSSDNRHVLLRHRFAGGDEFVMVDRQTPNSSFNINQLFNQTPSQISLRDKRFDQLYLYNGSDRSLQIGDTRAITVTPLLTHVVTFKPHDDKTILYVSDESSVSGQNTLRLYSAGKTYTLRQLPANDSYLLAVAHFDNRWYMAASVASENRTYVYRDPENFLKQQPATNAKKAKSPTLLPAITLTIDKPEFLSLSDSDRFLTVQSGSHFAVYDADSDRRYYYDVSPALEAGRQATWMDSDHLAVVSGGQAIVFDFDGTNKQTLVPADPNFPPFFSPDYKSLYTLAPSITVPGRAAITRADLVVK